jgi:alanyl-tRNA synthetase
LPRKNVDYGGGLARIAAASIDSPDVYRINLLWPIVQRLEELSGRSYDTDTLAMRVIADHLRGATFLAVDGVRPSNKEQGYVMRRLVRRAIRYAFDLGLKQNFFPEIIPAVAGIYSHDYPEVAERGDQVIAVLVKEEKAFRRTLQKGIKQLRAYADDGITGTELFTLYDTYGFPVELSTEEARQQGITVSPQWRAEFDERMAEQRRRSQQASKMKI